MTEQMMMEIIKAFVYGKTPDEVVDVTGVSVAEAEKFKAENEVAIAKKLEELKEAGYIE